MIVGAVGGAVVGNEMQKNQTELIWEIGVRYDDGSYGSITQTQAPGLRIGDRVRVTDTGLELLPRGRRPGAASFQEGEHHMSLATLRSALFAVCAASLVAVSPAALAQSGSRSS
jgi:hypothetical protein